MKCIIIDDESKARSLLRNLIQDHCKEIEILETLQDIQSAVKFLNNNSVDLVFLDIEMPNENGFALFDYFQSPSFATIFCTAYSEYAIKAFEVSALDYLLKPVSISKLKSAVEKALKEHNQNQIVKKINTFKENTTILQLQKIALPLSDGLIFIKIEDILYFEADGSYTYVITKKEKFLVSKKIKEFNELLEGDSRFFRVHRSFLVNIYEIKKYSKKDGSTLVFDNQKIIPVAREKKSEFDEFINKISV